MSDSVNLDQVYEVLLQEDRPMRAREIAEGLVARGYVSQYSHKVKENVSVRLANAIADSREDRFVRVSNGLYAAAGVATPAEPEGSPMLLPRLSLGTPIQIDLPHGFDISIMSHGTGSRIIVRPGA